MKHIFKIFLILTIVLQLGSSFGQTAEQRAELDQIQRDISAENKKIADGVARASVVEFFSERFGYIHQTNAQCIAIIDRIENLASQLKTPALFSKTYSSSAQAYEALEVLANLMIRDNLITNNVLKFQDELEIQKKNLTSTLLFLTYDKARVEHRFPKPDDVDHEAIYYTSLWNEYQSNVRQHGEKMKYYVSKCANIQLDVSKDIEARKLVYEDARKRLTDYFLKSYASEFANNILSKYQPTENTKLMLGIQSALNELDRRYRNAIMLDTDYFKAMAIIDGYENMATILLTRAVPSELNPTVRAEAEGEIKRRLASAKNYGKIINKEKPSYWLNKKYQKVIGNIKSGKSTCTGECKKHLDQVESLISAARIVEDISNDTTYAMLGYQALDFVK